MRKILYFTSMLFMTHAFATPTCDGIIQLYSQNSPPQKVRTLLSNYYDLNEMTNLNQRSENYSSPFNLFKYVVNAGTPIYGFKLNVYADDDNIKIACAFEFEYHLAPNTCYPIPEITKIIVTSSPEYSCRAGDPGIVNPVYGPYLEIEKK